MRDDLLHAQASVDWAVSKLPAFAEQVEEWLRENVNCGVEKLEAPAPYSAIIAKLKAPLPLSFNAEVGTYINAIRSSLDILASALDVRYCVGTPKAAYFPVAANASAFNAGTYKGSEFVKGLPGAERAVIESLKPYQGGNDLLYALHHLDIMRKHTRLLSVKISPGYKISLASAECNLQPLRNFDVGDMAAGAQTRDFILLAPGTFLNADHVPVLGFAKNGAPDYNIEFSPQVTFNEALIAKAPEVIGALREFASLAHSIIKLFD